MIGCQIEGLGARPHVGAIECDVDWEITHEVDPAVGGVRPERAPLAVEDELDELPVSNLLGQLLPVGCQGVGVAGADRLRPVGPRTVVPRSERHEQRVVVEPPRRPLAERVERCAVVRVGVGVEPLGSRPEPVGLVLADAVVVDVIRRKIRVGRIVTGVSGSVPGRQVRAVEVAVVDESVEANE